MDSSFFFEWEEQLMIWLQQIGKGTFLQSFLLILNNFLSFLGEEYFSVFVLGLFYWGFDKRKGVRMGLTLLPSMLANNMIKNVVRRLRPFKCSEDIELLREVDGYSFPSAHSSSSAGIYMTLAGEYKDKKVFKVIAVAIPLLIAISRVFVGAHWPTDVLCGLLLGYAFYFITEFLLTIFKSARRVCLVFLVIGLAGFFYCTTDDFFSTYGMLLGFYFALVFEERFVKFENTKSVPLALVRTVFGGLTFVVSNLILKRLFGNGLGNEYWYLLTRTIRYTLVCFICLGLYPMAFKPCEAWFSKKFSK